MIWLVLLIIQIRIWELLDDMWESFGHINLNYLHFPTAACTACCEQGQKHHASHGFAPYCTLLVGDDLSISFRKRKLVHNIINTMKYLSMTLIPSRDVEDNMLAFYILDYTAFHASFSPKYDAFLKINIRAKYFLIILYQITKTS